MESNKASEVLFITGSPEETKALGQAIGEKCRGGEVILLTGQLGAGKTTLVQGLARGLGVSGPVQSPSFVLERIHQGRLVLRHLDLYRLTAGEVEDAGLLSEIQESDVIVIEWADRAFDTLDAILRIEINLGVKDASERSIRVEPLSPAWESYLRRLSRRLKT